MRYGYSYDLILERVRGKVRERFGEIDERRHKGVYEDARVKLPRDQWKRKWEGDTRFSFEELDALADFFEAPNGWPLIDWAHAESLRDAAADRARIAELLARFAPPTPPAESAPAGPPQGPETASPSGQPGKRRRGGGRR